MYPRENKIMKRLALLTLVLLLPVFVFGQNVESILETRLAEEPVGSALSAVIVDENGATFYNTGTVSKEAGANAVDKHSVYEIGSITKVFTGILLAEAIKRGEVKSSDPISKYLPSSIAPLKFADKEITLVDLSTHGSALPSIPDDFKPEDPLNPYADYTVEQMYAFLGRYKLTREIGSQFEYSNLAVGLLGHILAKQAKMDYEDLVKKRILEPLGMNDTAITFTPEMKSRLAIGHDSAGKATPNWDLPTFAGAGALRSTPNDMAKFLAANLGLKKTSISDSLAKAQQLQHTYERENAPPVRIGFNWITSKPGEIDIQWHNGGTGGYRTFAGMDHSKKRGVFVATNGSASADDIGFHLLDPNAKLRAVEPPKKEVELSKETLEQYVGKYELTPAFAITITREGKQLQLQATDQPRFPLFAEKEDEFFLKVVKASVTFTRGEDGKVNGLILHQGGADTPGKKVQ
ncbi:MAG: serine hydrolase [Acidobacteria bacterium]|nr:MAG: serine hydrolase [Acidobacteriota bacterium]REJ98057.1 MAG: serine hydrolase [Acidobacteriota bacterium]REK16800.1 MAG: serine hydrolase [Acidobacteriota bacterium]REK42711.1 MAG: serine hydrolase [Acidobacteriota bacterium]